MLQASMHIRGYMHIMNAQALKRAAIALIVTGAEALPVASQAQEGTGWYARAPPMFWLFACALGRGRFH